MNPHLSVLQLVAMYGFAAIVGGSRITQPIRNMVAVAAHWLIKPDEEEAEDGEFGSMVASGTGAVILFLLELVECPQCFGFWEGLAIGMLRGEDWLGIVVMGCLVSGSNLLLESVVDVGIGLLSSGQAANHVVNHHHVTKDKNTA